MPARRYLAVTQDPRGYPAGGELEPPPDGLVLPQIHSVVLEADYEALEATAARLQLERDACEERCDALRARLAGMAPGA